MSLRKPADRCFSAAVLSQMQRGAVVEVSLASAGAAECWKATTDATRPLDQVKGERSKLVGDWGCRFEVSPALVEKHMSSPHSILLVMRGVDKHRSGSERRQK